MEIEEMMKALAQGGITVQGDLVMKKEVEYEVNNVEAGGIGIQVVNGKPTDIAGSKQAKGKREGKEVNEKDMPAKPTLQGPRKQYLFIEGDASWEEQGKPRNPSRENAVVRRRERDRFMKYLSLHKMGNRELTTTKDDTLNSIVASFLIVWRDKGWIAKDFSGNAVHRFLHEECGIRSGIGEQSYANKIVKWVKDKSYSIDVLTEVETFMKKNS